MTNSHDQPGCARAHIQPAKPRVTQSEYYIEIIDAFQVYRAECILLVQSRVHKKEKRVSNCTIPAYKHSFRSTKYTCVCLVLHSDLLLSKQLYKSIVDDLRTSKTDGGLKRMSERSEPIPCIYNLYITYTNYVDTREPRALIKIVLYLYSYILSR